MKFKENWPYYRKRIVIFLNLVVILFGLIGTYEYYRPIFSEQWRLIAAMLYGTVKLYFLSPTISMEAQITPVYEVAKWLAPVLTGTMILTILSNVFLHAKNLLLYRLQPKSVVIGENPDAGTFVRNLQKQSDTRVLLYTDLPLAAESAKAYESKGIAILTHDFRPNPDRETLAQVKLSRMNDAKNLVLFYENDLDNYAVFTTILQALAPHQPMKIRIRSSSAELRELMQQHYAQAVTKKPELQNLDIRYFEPAELVAESLLQDAPYPLYTVPIERLAAAPTPCNAQEISHALGTSHILAFGFNEITSYLIEKLASTATVSLTERVQISIVDSKAATKADNFLAKHPEIENAVTLHPISEDIGSRAFMQQLKNLEKDHPPVTYIVCNFTDTLMNLTAIAKLGQWKEVPIAVRNTSGRKLTPLFAANPITQRAFSYGRMSQVLTPSIILNEALDEKAIRHNLTYNETGERFGNGPGSSWDSLSFVKKDSSRAAALHAPFKEAVYQTLLPAENAKETLDRHRDYLAEVFTSGKDHYVANQALLKLLETHPALDYLTQIEHIRWCHYYYGIHFRYGKEKDEANKTHPCLIEDWEELSGPLYDVCYPIFDAIAVLSLFGEE